MPHQYWQLASGDTSRDFSKVMLDFGAACIGPGRLGPLSDESIPRYKQLGQNESEYYKIKPILDMKPGDRVVLKNGRNNILAVGEITGPYSHSSCFHDIDGWDMEHYVPIQWRDIQLQLSGNPLVRATLQRLAIPSVIAQIESLWDAAPLLTPIHTIADSGQLLADQLIEETLINHGLRIEDAENTTRTLARIRKLGEWYVRIGYTASEEEIKAFLVVPFLQALGWSPQRIGLEVNRRDLILYDDSERKKPCVIIETKSLYSGSTPAMAQVKKYAAEQSADPLRHLVVSDGMRYWLLEPNGGGGWREAAYMNLSQLRVQSTAYPTLKGALELIALLLPYR